MMKRRKTKPERTLNIVKTEDIDKSKFKDIQTAAHEHVYGSIRIPTLQKTIQ